MRGEGFGARIVRGSFFKRIKDKAAEYVGNPDKLRELIRNGWEKADSAGRQRPFREVWEGMMTFLRLLRAYAKGEYSQIPWSSLVLIVAAVLYFLAPIDVIPDFLVGLGYVDDAAVVAFVMRTVATVLDDFRKWEAARSPAADTGVAQAQSTN
jgi:uncharacterized membrane protein YkvA (DUF1232 family)